MPILEVLLFLSLAAAAVVSFIPRQSVRTWALRCAAVAAMIAIADAALGNARWQVVPAYVLASVVLLVTYLRWRRGRPPASVTWARVFLTSVSALLVCILLAVALIPPVAFPLFDPPAPTGPYGVGISDVHLVDTARAETMTDDPDDHRELMVRIWYPARVAGDAEPEPFLREVEPLHGVLVRGAAFLRPFMLHHLQRIRSHSYHDVPLAEGQAPFPVLIFSHGNSLYASQNSVLMEHLASHGYVVFGIDHPYQASAVRFPDGRVARYQHRWLSDGAAGIDQAKQMQMFYRALYSDRYDRYLRSMDELLSASPASNRGVQLWVDDTSFLLDELARTDAVPVIDRQDSHHALERFDGHLDLNHVGVFGMSLGGAAAGQFCAQDARCTAGLNMDGLHFGAAGIGLRIQRPFMFIYADQRRDAAMHVEGVDLGKPAPFRMNDFAYHSSSDIAYFMTIRGASHLGFADFALVSNFMRWSGILGTIDPVAMRDLLNDASLAFFNRTLKGTREPLLEGALGERPDVLEFGRRDGRVHSVE
jgi:predicted dienelactone hydrolase